MKDSAKRPTQLELNYGKEQYEKGFADGYQRCLWDLRKRKSTKEKCMSDKFSSYIDYMEDSFAANRKR